MSAWRNKAITILDETVFPGIASPTKSKLEPNEDEVVSSLSLQILLYFNIYFFPLWMSGTIAMLSVKFHCLTILYRFIAVTVEISAMIIEMLRLYLGYFGNLTEKMPEMAAFWMLSILLQFPLQVFLLVNRQLKQLPLEYIVQAAMVFMLIMQLVTGFRALRISSQHQASKFKPEHYSDSLNAK